ncbi:MAG: exodeoxyribonuclease VII small subunit [Parcubacteria group bacterium CG11_big_fil_rev_8_21_14_0_20_39_14]|nr:MAG: exodeoxyribonuclease VII small subunit [Parcubacteria group bacterium CG11_big_fil_rev_8_21_14_0_20_39_14]
MVKEEKNLQSALKQLEKIVDDLSGKDVDVEASLEKFKDGVSLIKFCRAQLQKAENEFEKLKSEIEIEKDEDGKINEEGEEVEVTEVE